VSTPAITLEHLTRRFNGGDRPAVDDVSLSVESGELLALLGPSGAGKTTVLRMVAGFEAPDAGRIRLGDRVVHGPGISVPPEARRLGFVFQHGALFPHLSVRDNIGFGLPHLSAKARRHRVAEMAELASITGLLDRYEHELSGGERQRAALARALARGCTTVLLDEPLSNVDRPLRLGIGAQLRSIVREAGATAVLVTHDQDEALALADRVAILTAGRLAQVGTPDEVRQRPASAAVRAFLGTGGAG
jgi:iron(III) transport system ATP-binding protein